MKIPAGGRRKERLKMVRTQIARRGIKNEDVLDAMRAIPREFFLPPELRPHAYADNALPIAEGQSISQPYIVALMAEALDVSHGDRVLEIGTGSGYAAAVLGCIAREVITLERLPSLAHHARSILAQLGYENIQVIQADGTGGWSEGAPYNAISVTAGAPDIPAPLVEQLVAGGNLVLPVGSAATRQDLIQCHKAADGSIEQRDLGRVRFVPLIGKHGWEGV